MEPLRIPVYYDFASSICYVAHRVMQRMAGELDELAVALEWTPLDLTGLTGWHRGGSIADPRRANALRVARDLKVALRMPSRWMDSRDANAVALSLARSEREPTWRERVFCAVYEQGRSLDDPATLPALARDLGLTLDEQLTRDARDALDVQTARAREAEVTGVPTFMLGPWPFGGIQEEPTMRSILGRWAARQRRGH